MRPNLCAPFTQEAALAFELARALIEKFGGDCLGDMHRALETYLDRINSRWSAGA